jgi:exoribonuclease R
MYTCNISSRDYSKWSYEPEESSLQSPLENKLFHGDTFNKNEDDTITVTHSPVRECQNIPGILLLENNRTYGRTENNKRLYYKCRPHDSNIPSFLVAFDLSMGFNKNFKNKYITFFFKNWKEKHPLGIISQNIGDVYDLPSFNEYQLYCKNLHHSITPAIAVTKETLRERSVQSIRDEIMQNSDRYGGFEYLFELPNIYTFSVDPNGCTDRDDAISIVSGSSGVIVEHVVSVHIANVWVWLDALQLWDYIGDRVSTIYFPDMKRPMLPTAVGENLCSLDEGKICLAMTMDITVIEHPTKGVYIQYLDATRPQVYQSAIKINKNFVYEEPALLKNESYKSLLTLTKKLDKTVKDSHNVIAYWMMQMNFYLAKHMKFERFGVFRTVQAKKEPTSYDDGILPPFVRIWEQQMSGEYVVYEDKQLKLEHELLGFSQYVHATSPIRRMADLLNQIAWMKHHVKVPEMSEKCLSFYDRELGRIDKMNRKMKKIRRVQADGHILHRVTHDPDILEEIYDGMVIANGDKATIYIERLEWLTQAVLPTPVKQYRYVKCKLFVFDNEEQMRKKIRIQIIDKQK